MVNNDSANKIVADDTIYRELGLRLPRSYLVFVSDHFKDLDDDPSNHCCWKSGFGNFTFLVGTTQAFRTAFKDFPKNLVIIGYMGQKRIVINHEEVEIDLFIGLDANTSEVFLVDTLGSWEKIAGSFGEWVSNFISWINKNPAGKQSFSVSALLDRLLKHRGLGK